MRTLTQYVEPIRAVLQNEADRTRYSEIVASSEADLRPQGMLEIAFAASIVRALWRLEHQAGASEADIARLENGMRRNTAELRRLQTDRHLKAQLGLDLPGLISAKDFLKWTREAASRNLQNEPKSEIAQHIENTLHAEIGDEEKREMEEFTKRTQSKVHRMPVSVPRNAPCPCKSGQKYKRCCGRGAPPVYNLSPQKDIAA